MQLSPKSDPLWMEVEATCRDRAEEKRQPHPGQKTTSLKGENTENRFHHLHKKPLFFLFCSSHQPTA